MGTESAVKSRDRACCHCPVLRLGACLPVERGDLEHLRASVCVWGGRGGGGGGVVGIRGEFIGAGSGGGGWRFSAAGRL